MPRGADRRILIGFVATLVSTLWTGTALAQTSGAIFTTTPDGGIVNENVRYGSKLEVYLDGGPPINAPREAAGLEDGEYVFQVTDPSGNVLLSSDPAKCRLVRVEYGVIVDLVDPSTYGLSSSFTVGRGRNRSTVECHVDDHDAQNPQAAGPTGMHDTNVDSDHGTGDAPDVAVVVQLMPFEDTPNPGGVYKAWMIPKDDYLANGGDLGAYPTGLSGRWKRRCSGTCYAADPGFGGPRSASKTDNFKVIEDPDIPVLPDAPPICLKKFHDIDADGLFEPDDANHPEPWIGPDPPQASAFCMAATGQGRICVEEDGAIDATCTTGGGWPIDVTAPDAIIPVPEYTFSELLMAPVGTYTFAEASALTAFQGDWAASATYLCSGLAAGVACGTTSEGVLTVPGPVTVPIEAADPPWTVVFGNYRPVALHAHKFFDQNGNGSQDSGEDDMAGITFCLSAGGTAVDADLSGGTVGFPCAETDSAGKVWWMNLLPGTYSATETLPEEMFPTTPFEDPSVTQTETLLSGESTTLEFGNSSGCSGLTPGYWKNWRNHYSTWEFETLLPGTIAPTIYEVDKVFAYYNASDPITILSAMLLANQLTLNLTQHPELPNPSGGRLFRGCTVPGFDGMLKDAIDAALYYHALYGGDPAAILEVKDVLDAFANQKLP